MRIPWAPLAALPLLSTALASSHGLSRPEGESFAVRATLPEGVFYAEQLVPFEVTVEGGGDDPRVELPSIPNVEFFPDDPPTAGVTADQSEREGGGTVRRLGFRVVSHRPGKLVIPSLIVRSGDQAARTGAIRRTIRSVPSTGRSTAFLGGVGALDLEAEAEPASVTVGRTINFLIRVRGTAALGTSTPRGLLGLDDTKPEIRVESQPAETTQDPELKTFRWSLRPTKPGPVVIPPQPIAYFDPGSSRFQTKWTRAIPIEVRDVGRFDPSSLTYARPTAERTRSLRWPWVVLATSGGLLAVSWLVVRTWWRRPSDAAPREPNRIAADLARRFAGVGDSDDAVGLAQEIGDSLSDYLGAARGRPKGALTPAEARAEVGAILASPEGAAQAARLIERCDWVCYSGVVADRGRIDPGETRRLADAARDLFQGLSRTSVGATALPGRNGASEEHPAA